MHHNFGDQIFFFLIFGCFWIKISGIHCHACKILNHILNLFILGVFVVDTPYDPSFCSSNSTNPSVVFISVKENQWSNYEMQSEVIYCVIQCENGGVLDLIAKNISFHDWIVVVNVPTLLNICEVRIFQEKGSNGVVVFNVPPPQNSLSSYELQMDKQLPSGFGVIEIANFQLRVTNLEHFLLNSATNIHVHVKSSPGDADLVFRLSASSFVTLDSLSSNILVKEATFNPSSTFISQSNFTMLLVGQGATSTIDLSYFGQAFYLDGCLTVRDADRVNITSNVSPWFQQRVASENTPLDLLQCPFATYQIDEMTITGSEVRVQGLGINKSCAHLRIIDGDFSLYADTTNNTTEKWQSVWINSTSLRVDNKFVIDFTLGRRAILPSSVFGSGNSILTIDCENYSSSSSSAMTLWVVGCSGQSTDLLPIVWQCDSHGMVCTDSNPSWNWPLLSFRSNSSSTLHLNVSFTQQSTRSSQRNVTLSSSSLLATFQDASTSPKNLTIVSTQQLSLNRYLIFHDGSNNVTVHESGLQSGHTTTLIIQPNASCNLSAPYDASISLPGNLIFVPQNRSVHSQHNSEIRSCFQPIFECNEANWIDVVYKRNPSCWIDLSRQCHQQIVINLITSNSLFCWFNSSSQVNSHYWTIPIFSSSQRITDNWSLASPSLHVIIPPIIFYFLSFLLSVGIWKKFRRFVDSGLSFIIMTSALQRVVPLIYEFMARALSDWTTFMHNLRDGPDCRSLVRFAIFFVVICLCLVILVITLSMKIFYRRRDMRGNTILYQFFVHRCLPIM
jgi:hypothetical protein